MFAPNMISIFLSKISSTKLVNIFLAKMSSSSMTSIFLKTFTGYCLLVFMVIPFLWRCYCPPFPINAAPVAGSSAPIVSVVIPIKRRDRNESFDSTTSTLIGDDTPLPAWMRAITLDKEDAAAPASPTHRAANGIALRNGHVFISKSRYELALRALQEVHAAAVDDLSAARDRIESFVSTVLDLQQKNVSLSASHASDTLALQSFHTATLQKLAALTKRKLEQDKATITLLTAEKASAAAAHEEQVRAIQEAASNSLREVIASTNYQTIKEHQSEVASLQEEKQSLVSSHEEEVRALRKSHEASLSGVITSIRGMQSKQRQMVAAYEAEKETATSSHEAQVDKLLELNTSQSNYIELVETTFYEKEDSNVALKEKVNALKASIVTISERIIADEILLQEKNATIDALTKEVNSLEATKQATISERETTNESLLQQKDATIAALHKEVDLLETSKQATVSELSASHETSQEKDLTIKALHQEVETLVEANQMSSKLVDSLETLRQEKHSTIGSLRKGITSLKAANQAVLVLASVREKAQKDAEAILSSLRGEIDSLKATSQLNEENSEAAIESLRQELAEKDASLHELVLKALVEKDTSHKYLSHGFQQEIISLQSQLAEKEASLKQLSQEALAEKEASLKQQSLGFKAEIESLQAEVKEKSESLEELTKGNAQAAAQNDVLISELKHEVDDLHQQIDELESQNADDLTQQLAIAKQQAKQDAASLKKSVQTSQRFKRMLVSAEEDRDAALEHAESCEKKRKEAQDKLNKVHMDDLAKRGVEWVNKTQFAYIRAMLAEKVPLENKVIRLHNENLRLKERIQDLNNSANLAREYTDDVSQNTLVLLDELKTSGITNVAHLAEVTNDEILSQLSTWLTDFINSANHNILAGRGLVAENNRLVASAQLDRELIEVLNETIATQADSLLDADNNLVDAQNDRQTAYGERDRAKSAVSKLKVIAERVQRLEGFNHALSDELAEAQIEGAPSDYANAMRKLQDRVVAAREARDEAERKLKLCVNHEVKVKDMQEEIDERDFALERRFAILEAVSDKNKILCEMVKELGGELDDGEWEGITPMHMRAMFEANLKRYPREVKKIDAIEEEIAWAERVDAKQVKGRDVVRNEKGEVVVEESPFDKKVTDAGLVAANILKRMQGLYEDIMDDRKGAEDIRYCGPDGIVDLTADAEAQKVADENQRQVDERIRKLQEEVFNWEKGLAAEDARILVEEAF